VHDENKDTVYLLVTGKHEEKADEHGLISRHFTRRFALPKDVDIKELQCNLSNKGLSARLLFTSLHLQASSRCRRRASSSL
jgi:HSP20 family molecular chaperone IbpA